MKYLIAFIMFSSAFAWGFDFIDPTIMPDYMIRVTIGFTILTLISVGIATLKGWW